MLEHVRDSLTALAAAAATTLQTRVAARTAAQAAVTAVQAQVAPVQAAVTQAEQEAANRQAALTAAQNVVAQRDAERSQAQAVRDDADRNVATIAGNEPDDVLPNGKPNPAHRTWAEKLKAAESALDRANAQLGIAQTNLSQAIQARDAAAASLGAAAHARDNARAQLAAVTNAVALAQQQVAATERDVTAAQEQLAEAQTALAAVAARIARLTAEPLDRSDLSDAADREYESLAAARAQRYDAWSRRAALLRRRTTDLQEQDLAMAAVRAVRGEIELWADSSHFAQLQTLRLDGAYGLVNPGFEDGTTGWHSRLPGQNLQALQSAEAKQGTSFAQINNGSADITTGPSLYQDVPVVTRPGQTFVFSIWVRSADGQPYSGTVALWGLGGVNEPGSTSFSAGSAWTEVSAHLDVANAGHYALRTEIYMNTEARDLDLDGARLVEVREGVTIDLPTDLGAATTQLSNALAALGAAGSQAVAERDTAAAQLAGAAKDLADHEAGGPP